MLVILNRFSQWRPLYSMSANGRHRERKREREREGERERDTTADRL